MGIRFASVCSGIEAASVAWHPLGWQTAWLAEIEAFPSAVLAHHYPSIPNLGDMTLIRDRVRLGEVEAPDVLVGGTPCQAFSVAGARQSLDDDRGQLTLEYVRLLDEIDAARLVRGQCSAINVWENVPGVFNTNDNAFGCFLGALAGEECELQPTGKKWTNSGCVFGPQRTVAWRVLDAQYFGLAQRRKRVFVVASARKDFSPIEVLFESEGVRRDFAPSRSSGQEVARSTKSSPYLASGKPCIGTLMANAGTKLWLGNQEAFSGDYAIIHPRRDYKDATDLDDTVFGIQGSMIGRSLTAGPAGSGVSDDISFTLTKGDRHGVAVDKVRRLTPIECERLQGFPDNYTQIPYRNKSAEECPDGPRYAACGNSMAVSVMAWIGKRIDAQLREIEEWI